MMPRLYRDYRYRKPRFGTRLNRRHPLAQDMVGFWLLNRGRGTTAFDSAGNNNGQLMNFADPPTATSGWTWGADGKALQFDGTSNWVSGGTSDIYNLTSPFTLLARIKRAGSGSEDGIVQRYGGADEYPGYGLGIDLTINNNAVRFWTGKPGGAGSWLYSSTTITDTDWHDVLGVWDGTNRLIYIDGRQVASDTQAVALNNPGDILTIGSFDAGANNHFAGTIAFVGIFNRAFITADVNSLLYRPYEMFEQPWKWLYGAEAVAVTAKTSYVSII